MISTDVRLVTYAGLLEGEPDTPLIIDALRSRGLNADVRAWNDPDVDWGDAALTVLRSTWDYHLDRQGFLAWLDTIETKTRLHNPAHLVRWNSHKSYLTDLRSRGLPIVPTLIVKQGENLDLEQVERDHGWRRVVLKPAVSLDGHGVSTGCADDPALVRELAVLSARGDVVVQPFVESVTERGELSVSFIDGLPCHAVRKRPAAGDFRVQVRLGGSVEATGMPEAAGQLGIRALSTLDAMPLYARVDLVEEDEGLCISELELIEPSLFITFAPETALHFAAAMHARLEA